MSSNEILSCFIVSLSLIVIVSFKEASSLPRVSKSTVNCWIKRKSFPEMDTIQKIADALNCKTDDLLVDLPERFSPAVEDLQLERLWPLAPTHAKRAAIAVLLQLMKDEEEEVLGIDLSEV